MQKAIVKEWLLILSIAVIASVQTALFHPKRPAWYVVETYDPWTFQADELRAELGGQLDSVLWVDARKSAYFEKERMEGAINLSREEWEQQIAQNIDRLQSAIGKPVVVYCDGSRCKRSGEIAQRLRELLRLEPVYVLKGNWRKWQQD